MDRDGRRRRPHRPRVDRLEGRELLFVLGVTGQATPAILAPPNGRFATVAVSGVIAESRNEPPEATFQVIDEYRRIEPSGRIRLSRTARGQYTYSFTVRLQASRADQDRAGRQYYLIVAARDRDGSNGKVIPVLVPHDRAGEKI